MDVDVKYNINGLKNLAKQYPEVVADESLAVMNIIVARLEKDVVEGTPVGVGGAAGLRGSINGTAAVYGLSVMGSVGTPVEYGLVVEKGRRAGQSMPPTGPIALWAQRKLGVSEADSGSVAFAIARKIARQGFEGAHMFQAAWEKDAAWIQDMLNGIPGRVVRRLGSGA